MSIKNRRTDDGYDGLIMNPDTGQIMQSSSELNQDPFYIRVDGPGAKPLVKASKAVSVEKHVGDIEAEEEEAKAPVVEPTPEVEYSVDDDAAELALTSLQAEAAGTKDKSALKTIGASLGLKLTNNMNVSTMQSRIGNQIDEIRAASEGE